AVESRKIHGEPQVPTGSQWLGSERPTGQSDRGLHVTESRELVPVPELRRTVVRSQLHRTAILRFRSAPVKVGLLKQETPGNMRGGETRREGKRTVGRRARVR